MLSKDNMSSFNDKKITDILIDMKKPFNEYIQKFDNNNNKLKNKILDKKCSNKYFYINHKDDNFIWILVNDIYTSLKMLKLDKILETIFFKVNYNGIVINLLSVEFNINKKYFNNFRCKKPLEFGINIKGYITYTEEMNNDNNLILFINKNDRKHLNIYSFNVEEGEKTAVKMDIY